MTSATYEGVVFCVKPSQPSTAKCPSHGCQQCETLQHYFENMDTINQQVNVTMVFMSGTHATNRTGVLFETLSIKMTGESQIQKVSIECILLESYCTLMFVFEIVIENLEMTQFVLMTLDFTIPANYSKSSAQHEFHIVSVNLTHCEIMFLPGTQVHIEHVIMANSSSVMAFGIRDILFNKSSLYTSNVVLYGVMSTIMKDCGFFDSTILIQSNSSIVFSGMTKFIGTGDDYASAITSYFSNITLSGTILFANNTSSRGGAMALYSSTLYIVPGVNVTFVNNSASHKGGAIYVQPLLAPLIRYDSVSTYNISPSLAQKIKRLINRITLPPCFYQLLDCSDGSKYNFHFTNNSAVHGGGDIYGASLKLSGSICQTSESGNCKLTVSGVGSGLSSVSSDPLRVCLCDSNGKPQCNNTYVSRAVHPGEIFVVSAVLVGGDFGTTTGIVYAHFLPTDDPSVPKLNPSQLITNSTQCGELRYTLYAYVNHTGNVVLYLTTSYNDMDSEVAAGSYHDNCSDGLCLYTTPVFINITLLSCPPGFTILEDPPRCDCYPVLTNHGVKCDIRNGTNYLSWRGSSWMDIENNKVNYIEYCPFDYCNTESKQVDMVNNSSAQCTFNRAGRLCGGCMKNHSLAIGSSHCIYCHNNNNLALIIFFAGSGILLVFFISVLNLTVTQGMINGLIFYANIVWIYQSIFFSNNKETNAVMIFLKTFIAWVNLDFGIETCFVKGLTAFWKTWLQFVFPLYIWCIMGLIIVVARHSTRLTNLLGNRGIPVLSTLFLLSYMKLAGIIGSAFKFSFISEYPQDFTENPNPSVTVVWSVDGNLSYIGFPHILLFLAGLATLLFLWLPYTIMLLLVQWLRKVSHLRPLKWIMRFHPIYDAYFAPLKHKHQYWFGVLLVAREIFLVTFTSAFGIPYSINLLLLLVCSVALLFYMNLMQIYKTTSVLLLNSSFLLNLILLSGCFIFIYTQPDKHRYTLEAIAIGISAGFAFIQFCGIVLYAIVIRCVSQCPCEKAAEGGKDHNDRRCEPLI